MYSGSIGIIGGADGPTAIFVASNMSVSTIVLTCLIAGLVVGFVAAILYRCLKNRKDGK